MRVLTFISSFHFLLALSFEHLIHFWRVSEVDGFLRVVDTVGAPTLADLRPEMVDCSALTARQVDPLPDFKARQNYEVSAPSADIFTGKLY